MTIRDSKGVLYFLDDEDVWKLCANAKKLIDVVERHRDWVHKRKAKLRDLLQVDEDLMVCLKRIESCFRELDEEEREAFGDALAAGEAEMEAFADEEGE